MTALVPQVAANRWLNRDARPYSPLALAPSMFSLRGRPALTPFRRQKLRSELAALVPSLTSVEAEFVYFVETKAELDTEQRTRLESLLPLAAADCSRGGNSAGRAAFSSDVAAPFVSLIGLLPHQLSDFTRDITWRACWPFTTPGMPVNLGIPST